MEANSPKNTKSQEGNAFFSEALDAAIADFPKRSQEIVRARYGVDGKGSLTLEEIGRKYSITRERVRQVIREVLRKVKENKEAASVSEVRSKIAFTIRENSGIMEEKSLLAMLGGDSAGEQGAARFFLDCLDEAEEQEVKGELRYSFSDPSFKLSNWRAIKSLAVSVLAEKKEPMSDKEIFAEAAGKAGKELDKKEFLDSLAVSEEILRNNFGKWGLSDWKEISPKGTREKAYLILKEAGRPLHFKDIAGRIDKFQLSKKKTHPQTVHNELIKDGNFVLVGRGIYALSEWGYKKGTVKDVLEEILVKSKKPLRKDEILEKVLEVRQVKKSTIVINLNNFFAKNKAGEYTLKK